MSGTPFVAEIRLFPFGFAPTGWASCSGQLVPIFQNTALFSLLGTMYGGDGKSTFALPNLNGRMPVGQGQGPGLSRYEIGGTGGSETVTLIPSEIPVHTHTLQADAGPATTATPALGAPATSELPLFHDAASTTAPLAAAGGSMPHNNMQPYLTMYYAIALEGVFPPRG